MMQTVNSISVPSTTACDRCHGIKARCTFTPGRDKCDRCFRLFHECETKRVIGKAGRPQTRQKAKLASGASPPKESPSSSGASPGSVMSTGDPFSKFDPKEVALAQYLVRDQKLDQRFVNSFAIESYFNNTMESTLVRQLLAAPEQIKDALLALCGALVAEDESDTAPGSEQSIANMQQCCAAMEKLRMAMSTTEDDARAILFVATSLISFNDLTVGYGYLPVARAALIAVKPWRTQLVRESSSHFDPNLIPVVFAEAMECQKSAEIPTLCWVLPDDQLIDRSYGIAHEVLPYLYQICVLTHDLFQSGLQDDILLRRAAEIEADLYSWIPHIAINSPSDKELNLSENQKSQMVAHAYCYKLMAHLLLEQIQAHVKDNRTQRKSLASQIQRQASQFYTGGAPRVLYLLYSYFVACTELEDPEEQNRVLAQMKYLSGGIATQCCNTMYQFLQFFWARAASNPNLVWIELVGVGPPFSIGP